ncbi:MAG: Nif11-like leader peptide family natural product precursor [Fischerella sp.]|nr:Nif11-like leader peptide family natural product precursor [Fischerella sp.]
MSQQEVIRLFRAVQIDSNLRGTLNSAPDLETFVQMAQNHGYDFTIEEWQKATGLAVENLDCQLSEIQGI